MNKIKEKILSLLKNQTNLKKFEDSYNSNYEKISKEDY